jgi:hypothetical protein
LVRVNPAKGSSTIRPSDTSACDHPHDAMHLLDRFAGGIAMVVENIPDEEQGDAHYHDHIANLMPSPQLDEKPAKPGGPLRHLNALAISNGKEIHVHWLRALGRALGRFWHISACQMTLEVRDFGGEDHDRFTAACDGLGGPKPSPSRVDRRCGRRRVSDQTKTAVQKLEATGPTRRTGQNIGTSRWPSRIRTVLRIRA